MLQPWIVYSPKERLWWSNGEGDKPFGWADRQFATRFTPDEKKRLRLPIGGKWVRF